MKEYTCKTCGAVGTYEPVVIEGRELKWKPAYCDPCGKIEHNESQKRQDEALQAAQKQRVRDQWATICPPLYQLTDPTRLPQDKLTKVMEWQYGAEGLVIHGDTGRGKTRAAYLLLRSIHFEEGKKIAAFHSNTFAHRCAKEFFEGSGEDWIAHLSTVDVLFLDDLGKSKFTERVECELFGLIENRVANLKPIIVTTNFVGESLASKMTNDRAEPMVRRLREFCQSVSF